MRTNIDIDDALMSKAMQAGPYQTKKEAVEAGLKLLARQVAYREILKWEGKLKWEGDESIDWTQPVAPETSDQVTAPPAKASGKTLARRKSAVASKAPAKTPAKAPTGKTRRAGR